MKWNGLNGTILIDQSRLDQIMFFFLAEHPWLFLVKTNINMGNSGKIKITQENIGTCNLPKPHFGLFFRWTPEFRWRHGPTFMPKCQVQSAVSSSELMKQMANAQLVGRLDLGNRWCRGVAPMMTWFYGKWSVDFMGNEPWSLCTHKPIIVVYNWKSWSNMNQLNNL